MLYISSCLKKRSPPSHYDMQSQIYDKVKSIKRFNSQNYDLN